MREGLEYPLGLCNRRRYGSFEKVVLDASVAAGPEDWEPMSTDPALVLHPHNY